MFFFSHFVSVKKLIFFYLRCKKAITNTFLFLHQHFNYIDSINNFTEKKIESARIEAVHNVFSKQSGTLSKMNAQNVTRCDKFYKLDL